MMPFLPVLLFAGALLGATWRLHLAPAVALGYLLASVVCFAAYARDKAAARAGRARTRERTLLLLGLAGGWPGAVLAQQAMRHKTRKRPFQGRFWISVLVHVGVAGALAWLLLPPHA